MRAVLMGVSCTVISNPLISLIKVVLKTIQNIIQCLTAQYSHDWEYDHYRHWYYWISFSLIQHSSPPPKKNRRHTATMDRLSLLVTSVVRPLDLYKKPKNVSTFKRLEEGYSKNTFITIHKFVLQICGLKWIFVHIFMARLGLSSFFFFLRLFACRNTM